MTEASAATVAAPALDVSGLLEMLLSLALVVALIIALSWLMGRLRGVSRGNSGPLSIIGELTVGPKERVVLVRVGDQQALVGVCGESVQSLSLLEKPVEVPAASAEPGFAARLKEMINRGGAAKSPLTQPSPPEKGERA